MNKVLKKLMLFLPIGLQLIACNKNNSEPKIANRTDILSSVLSRETFALPDNYLILRYSKINSPVPTENGMSVTLLGNFSNNSEALDVGNITVQGRLITPQSKGSYYFDYKEENVLNEGLSLLNSHVEISIPENLTTSAILDTISFPGALNFTGTNQFSGRLSKNQNYTVSWNTNTYNNSQLLVIQVYYLSGMSKYFDPAMPNKIESIKYTVANTGSFTIPSADFARFPLGSYVEVMIGTGSFKIERPAKGPEVYFLTVSDECSTPLKVVE